MIPRWFTAFAGLAILLAFFIGGWIGRHSALHGNLPPEGRWSPCFSTAESGDMPALMRETDAAVLAAGGTIVPLANTMLVPEGRQAGAWILPGCVAVEDRYGDVVFWQDRSDRTPRWIPYTD